MVRAALPDRRVSITLVIRRVNQDAGLLIKQWALRCSSSEHCELKALSLPVALICIWSRCSVVRMREVPDPFLPPSEVLWRSRRSIRSLREHNYQAAAAWQVPSPSSAWKDASRPENDVRSAVPVGGYVKITSLSWLWEMTANRLFLWRPEGSSEEVRLLHKNLLA